jgi:hypothetical protein
MMRATLLILIIAVIALIAAISSGYLDISQTREAKAPSIEARDGAIRATGGQSPAFEVQTGSVQVGTREASVAVPKVEVKRNSKSVNVPVVEVRGPQEAQQNAAH